MLKGNNISKFKMAKILLNIDDKGSIVNLKEKKVWENSGLEYLKIKTFKIEPYGTNLGIYSIDGEVSFIFNY